MGHRRGLAALPRGRACPRCPSLALPLPPRASSISPRRCTSACRASGEDASVKLYHAQSLFKAGARASMRPDRAFSVDDRNLETLVARLLLVGVRGGRTGGVPRIPREVPRTTRTSSWTARARPEGWPQGRRRARRSGDGAPERRAGLLPDVACTRRCARTAVPVRNPCLKHLAGSSEPGVREYPELLVGAVTALARVLFNVQLRGGGNTPALPRDVPPLAFRPEGGGGVRDEEPRRGARGAHGQTCPPARRKASTPSRMHMVVQYVLMDTDPDDTVSTSWCSPLQKNVAVFRPNSFA